jgi:hypothetical protein
MTNQEQPTETPKKTGKIIFWIVMLILAAVAAFFTFRVVKGMVASWEITSLPGLAIKHEDPTATPERGKTAAAPDQEESAPAA